MSTFGNLLFIKPVFKLFRGVILFQGGDIIFSPPPGGFSPEIKSPTANLFWAKIRWGGRFLSRRKYFASPALSSRCGYRNVDSDSNSDNSNTRFETAAESEQYIAH